MELQIFHCGQVIILLHRKLISGGLLWKPCLILKLLSMKPIVLLITYSIYMPLFIDERKRTSSVFT